MRFLYPAFLFGGLAIAIPIVLHLLRRDIAPEVPFTAVRLLRKSPVEREEHRRLRDLLLLLARVVALLLLAAAFARPYLRGAAPVPVRIVAVDRSYSMGPGSRFAKALEQARSAVDGAARGERLAVLAFDDRVDVLAQPGGAADARAALASLSVGFGGTRYPPVFDKAMELAAGAPARLILVGDLQRAGWQDVSGATLPADWQLEVRDIGAMQDNLAVTSVAVDATRVVASVTNTGRRSRTSRVIAKLDGVVVARADATVDPGQRTEVPLAFKAPATGTLAVSVDDGDGLPADDVRYAALGARGTARVLIASSGERSGLFLSRALETSVDEESGFDSEVLPGSRVSTMTVEQMANYPVIAVLSTRSLERQARETLVKYVEGGGGLFVAAGPDVEASVMAALTEWQPPWSVNESPVERVAGMTLAATDLRHPIFRPFGALAANLGQVRFERAWRVAPDGWSVFARFSDGTPALLERPLGQGRVVLFASDVDRRWNDFPLHPAFVPFALESVRYVAGDRRQARDYTVAEAPPGTGPGPGVYRSTDNRMVAINVDPLEGRLDSMSAADFAGLVERSGVARSKAVELQARQTESRQSYWQYGLIVMIAALVAESFVGRA
jgi:hypothetical protein